MASPNHHSTLWKTPHLNNKVKSEIEVAQWCLILCDPMDCSLPGSSLHGILQARVLEWVTVSFSTGSSRPRDRTRVSCIVDRCLTIWATRGALNNKQNKNTNPIISREDYHLTQPCPSEGKQTNKWKLSTNFTLYKDHINHWTNLRRVETKGKKNSSLKAGKRRPQTE